MPKKIDLLIILSIYGGFVLLFFLYRAQYSDRITIEAHFMQYACGDENDDMKVYKVSSKHFQSMVGKDIDPYVFAWKYELKDYFFEQKDDGSVSGFRLTGYLSKDALSGCSEDTPKFLVKKIEWIDGSNQKTNWDFY